MMTSDGPDEPCANDAANDQGVPTSEPFDTREHSMVWRLAGEDARAFAEAILGPPVPAPRLEAAYARYLQMKRLRREPPSRTLAEE